MSEPAGFSPRLLIAELADADVEFCVVGAFAMAVHGYPRATADLDVAVTTSTENLSRLAGSLKRLEPRSEPGGEVHVPTAEQLGSQGELKLYTRFGPLHIITDVEGVPSFRELDKRAVTVEVEGRQVRFASREDVVEMKKRSGRLIDRADLERLAETGEGD